MFQAVEMSQYLNKSIASIDQLYEVVADAYRNEVSLYYCLKCFQLFLTEREKLNHDDTHASEDECYACGSANFVGSWPIRILFSKCDECRLIDDYKMTKVKANIDASMSTVVDVELEDYKLQRVVVKKYRKCLWCEKVLLNELDLNVHVRNHFDKMSSIIKSHKSDVSNDCSLNTILKCLEFRQTFSPRHHLKSPKRTNTGGKLCECFECGNVFSQSGNLTLHKQTNKGEKPHECLDCGKCFSRNDILTDHKRTRTGEKPYKCLDCTK